MAIDVDGCAMKGPVTETVYDFNSNLTDVIDPRGVLTHSQYDALNRPTDVTTADGTTDAVTTETQYDENGNVEALILNPGAGTYEEQRADYAHDAFDRQTDESGSGDTHRLCS